jgi:hypothetical protein
VKISDLQQYGIGANGGCGFVKVADVARLVEELELIYTLARSFVLDSVLDPNVGVMVGNKSANAQLNRLCEEVLKREPPFCAVRKDRT